MARHAIAARAAIVSQRWGGGEFCPRRRSPAKVGSRCRSVALERRRTQPSILDFSSKKKSSYCGGLVGFIDTSRSAIPLVRTASVLAFFGNRKTVRIRLYYRGRRRILSVEEVLGRSFHPSQNKNRKGKNYMKKLLLIALVVSGLAFVPVQRSDAQVSVGIGGVGIGFGYPGYRYGYYGYPGYGYGYYPYGYYRSYPDYGYYTGRSYYGHRVYRHHRHHYYRSRY